MLPGTDKIPPLFESDSDYDQWKKDLNLWCEFTSIPKCKQAIAVHLSLTGRARKATSELTADQLKCETGIKNVTDKLDRVFLQDPNWKTFNTYLDFENYRRPKDCSIDDYLSEFDLRYYKLKECEVNLPDAVIACRLLKSCGLSDMHFQLALSTVPDMTFENMRNTLKKLFAENSKMLVGKSASSDESKTVVKVEPHSDEGAEGEAFYASSSRGRGWYGRRSRGTNRGGYKNSGDRRGGKNDSEKPGKRMNPLNRDGTVSKCLICDSKMHWARDCLHAYERNENDSALYSYGEKSEEEIHITLFTQENDAKMDHLLGETIGCIILDSGCSRTVCGEQWLNMYMDTLDDKHRRNVISENSSAVYRFGDGEKFSALRCVTLPCMLAGKTIQIKADVVSCNIPLLLSKRSMKRADMVIDLKTDTATIFGTKVKLNSTSLGHYTLPIYFPATNERICSILINSSDIDNTNAVLKLHRQFAHPSSIKLKQFLKNAGRNDPDLLALVDKVSDNCTTCTKYKKPKSRPIVSLPLGTTFNETLAMDLKVWKIGVYFLVLVDLATRFCQAIVINNKRPDTVIKAIFSKWISVFGAPRQIFSDNGCEFNNEVMKTMSDNFGIKLLCTAAEAPWSNGVCERLNAILATSVKKIIEDSGCDLETALFWAVSSRNALTNCHGFAPNQLVFGYNPAVPNVFEGTLPQLEGKTTSQAVAANLNAMHSARRDFLSNESNEKLRRALLHRVRTSDVEDLVNGDSVYFKRNNEDKWCGPGTVIGRDGKQVLVKHGGTYIRAHTCRLQHAKEENVEGNDIECGNDFPSDRQIAASLPSSPPTDDEVIADADETSVDDESDSAIVDNSAEPPSTSTVSAQTSKPKIGQRIECWSGDDSRFLAKIISRAGKATGKYKNCYNIEKDDGTVQWIDFDSLVKWNPVSEENEVLFSAKTNQAVYNAKIAEIENWKSNNVFSEVDDECQETISLRWVLTEKLIDGEWKPKARLVARGFEEDLFDHRTDSPTCSRDTLRIALSLMSSSGWTCNTIDIKAAFLQGEDINREVFVKPPIEFNNGMLWKLNKTVYGLCDAARAWYFKVKSVLIKLGMTMSKLDHALFMYHSEGLSGIVCIYVDDFCWAGDAKFERVVIDKMYDEFLVGSSSSKTFKYIGIEIEQDEQDIMVHQSSYVKTLSPLLIKHSNNRSRSDDLQEDEKKEYRAIVGQLNWISTQTRPDISYDVCELSSFFKTAKVDDALRLNKVVKKAKANHVILKYPKLDDLNKLTIECYSDASYGNLNDGGSQGGYVIFLSDGDKLSPIAWQSRRLRRIVKSTLAAETLALLDVAEAGIYLENLLCELLNLNPGRFPVKCYVDNKSLVEAVYSTKAVEDKQLRINIAILREMVSKTDVHSVSWVRSSRQLANVLTKKNASSCSLLAAIAGNEPTIKY